MTATPIPRTLHMAMLGIRDLSVIQTPPPDRQAIRTFVAHFDDGLMREVILRELNRGGQVFFVHNRVENIEYMARHLRSLLPEAQDRRRARPDEGARQLEERDARFHREPRQRVGLLDDHRVRTRYSQRQHDDHQSRRSFRPGAALSIARTGRALEAASLRILADSRRAHHHARRQTPDRRAARTGRSRKRHRLQARDARPRASRRRQSARQASNRARSRRSASSCTPR